LTWRYAVPDELFRDVHVATHRFMESLTEVSLSVSTETMAQATELLLTAHSQGKRIYLMGNGGSATTATHFACDLTKTAHVPGCRPLRAFCLTDNPALVTAWGNDADYAVVFSEQIGALVEPGDVVIAISASGKSPNIVAGLKTASERGAHTVGLLGFDGGPSLAMVDVAIHVPCHDYGVVESVHLGVVHAVTAAIRAALGSADTVAYSCMSAEIAVSYAVP
jgi:D-sedoheptulose 7-phosphate isomerase